MQPLNMSLFSIPLKATEMPLGFQIRVGKQ